MTFWDSCEDPAMLGVQWFPTDSPMETLSISSEQVFEGAGALKVDIFGVIYDIWVWKRKGGLDGWTWDFNPEPLVTIRIFPTRGVVFRIGLVDDGWNSHYYFEGTLVANQWNTINFDARRDKDGNLIPPETLALIVQLSIRCEAQNTPMVYFVDGIETAPAEPLATGTLECNAKADSVSVSASVEVVGVGIFATPFSRLLDAGTYAVKAWYRNQIDRSIEQVTIQANRTTTLNFQFRYIAPKPTYELHNEGRNWVNSQNQLVHLHGVDFQGFLESPGGYFFNFNVWEPDQVQRNLERLRNLGFNYMRLEINVQWWIQDAVVFQGISFPSYRQNLKDVVNMAEEEGIYCMVTLHTTLPPGEYNSADRSLYGYIPFPPYNSPEERAWIPSEQSFIDLWTNIAQELAIYPNVFFELWNEPVNTAGSGKTDAESEADWFRVAQTCITEIRKITQKIVVVHWEYCWWVGWAEYHQMTGGNLAYSGHIYRVYGSFGWPVGPDNPYLYDDVKAWMDDQLKYYYVTHVLNLPVMVGEIGTVTGDAREQESFRNALSVLNEWEIPYSGFWWRESGPRALFTDRTSLNLTDSGITLADAASKAPFPEAPTPISFMPGLLEVGLGGGAGVVTFAVTRNVPASVLVALATAGITYVIRNPPQTFGKAFLNGIPILYPE